MDLLIATGIFLVLILGPILWRSRGKKKKRIVEKIVLVLFFALLIFALRVFH